MAFHPLSFIVRSHVSRSYRVAGLVVLVNFRPTLARAFHLTARSQAQPALAELPTFDASLLLPDETISQLETEPRTRDGSTTLNCTFRGDIRAKLDGEVVQDSVSASIPLYHRGFKFERVPYWQKIPRWSKTTEEEFLSYSWSTAKNIQGKLQLAKFLEEVLLGQLSQSAQYSHIQTRDAFIQDVMDGIDEAPMSIRLTPHILSCIDWSNPIKDPIRRQFIPMKSSFLPNHPKFELDSLHEMDDSPVEGLVHRYPDKALFLACSTCPLYCRYCTRSYAVGANTLSITKSSIKPKLTRWEACFQYISSTPTLQDIVISGGDSYLLQPHHVRLIGERLLAIPHIRRFRFATKGLVVAPSRTLDRIDRWTEELIRICAMARARGKSVALHTHFNHPREFSWVSREAAQRLYASGVVVRNQSVLLRGVNDDAGTMGTLIRELTNNNIQPYYVYQGDMVQGVEDLRTPLQTILDLECQLRGSIAGFAMPQFVVDLPGGGGKRLAASYKTYDKVTGVSTFVAPAVKGRGKEDRVYEYYDPLVGEMGEGLINSRMCVTIVEGDCDGCFFDCVEWGKG